MENSPARKDGYEMGYVHDVAMSRWFSPKDCMRSAGTWAEAEVVGIADVWCLIRTAAAAAFNLAIPIRLWQNSADGKGCKLVSVDVGWICGTADPTTLTASIFKVTKQADGAVLAAGTAVTFTYDAEHLTNAARVDQDEHWMTLTITTPEWMDDDVQWHVEIYCDAALTSALQYLGARANYTLRL
jgi:hypothetical protein